MTATPEGQAISERGRLVANRMLDAITAGHYDAPADALPPPREFMMVAVSPGGGRPIDMTDYLTGVAALLGHLIVQHVAATGRAREDVLSDLRAFIGE